MLILDKEYVVIDNNLPDVDPGPWPFPKSPEPPVVEIIDEDFDEILDWTPEDAEDFLRTIKENHNMDPSE